MLTEGEQSKEIPIRALDLCTAIWAGAQPVHACAYYLEFLVFNLPKNRLIPALEWLLKRGIKGELFADFVATQCAGSGLELIRHVTKGIEKDLKLRKIYARDLQ
jgi:hypothetical protein